MSLTRFVRSARQPTPRQETVIYDALVGAQAGTDLLVRLYVDTKESTGWLSVRVNDAAAEDEMSCGMAVPLDVARRLVGRGEDNG